MNGMIVLASLCFALFIAYFVKLFVRPPRRLSNRVSAFTQLNRSRLGKGADVAALGVLDVDAPRSTVGRIFGPIGHSWAEALSRVIDAGDDHELALRLRQAGFLDTSPSQYRIRQLTYTLTIAIGMAALGIFIGNTGFTLLGFFGGGFYGATIWRGRVTTAIQKRRVRMRVELYTVAQLIAMQMRTGHGSVNAVQEVCHRGHGPVIRELSEALSWMTGGMSQPDAYDRLSTETPEPSASRLYRALADGARTGGDLSATLLSISEDLRTERREELERSATKRRGAMLIPTIVFMAPVVLIFMCAPIPHLLFGS
jgi:Flp pilus assembly protein TadB